jgi:hypothetical protein
MEDLGKQSVDVKPLEQPADLVRMAAAKLPVGRRAGKPGTKTLVADSMDPGLAPHHGRGHLHALGQRRAENAKASSATAGGPTPDWRADSSATPQQLFAVGGHLVQGQVRALGVADEKTVSPTLLPDREPLALVGEIHPRFDDAGGNEVGDLSC